MEVASGLLGPSSRQCGCGQAALHWNTQPGSTPRLRCLGAHEPHNKLGRCSSVLVRPGDSGHLCAARPSDQGPSRRASAAHLLPQHGAVRGTALVLLPRGLPPPQRAQLRAARYLSDWEERQERGLAWCQLVAGKVDKQARGHRTWVHSTSATTAVSMRTHPQQRPSRLHTWQLGTVHCVACICSSIHMRLQGRAGQVGEHARISGKKVAPSCTVRSGCAAATTAPACLNEDWKCSAAAASAPACPSAHPHRQYWQLPASLMGQFMAWWYIALTRAHEVDGHLGSVHSLACSSTCGQGGRGDACKVSAMQAGVLHATCQLSFARAPGWVPASTKLACPCCVPAWCGAVPGCAPPAAPG